MTGVQTCALPISRPIAVFFGQCRESGEVAHADAAAVGDTYNDIPMLERVGHSFIVDNAEEHMNAHAKWRIPSNNDGGVLTLIDAILAAR